MPRRVMRAQRVWPRRHWGHSFASLPSAMAPRRRGLASATTRGTAATNPRVLEDRYLSFKYQVIGQRWDEARGGYATDLAASRASTQRREGCGGG